MSEENQAIEVEEDNATIETPLAEVGEVENVEEVEIETAEAKAERLELELTELRAKSEKSNKGLLKGLQKERAKRDRMNAELTESRTKLSEFTGESLEQNTPKADRNYEAEARYNLKVEQLGEDNEFSELMNTRRINGSDPFSANPLIDRVMMSQGIDPKIAKAILQDDDLCHDLSYADNENQISNILNQTLGMQRYKNTLAKQQVKETPQLKKKKTTGGPTPKLSGTSKSRTNTDNMSSEDRIAMIRARNRGK